MRRRRFRPAVECLEGRLAPATIVWKGGCVPFPPPPGSVSDWHLPCNWIPAIEPTTLDDVLIPGLGASTTYYPILTQPRTIRSLGYVPPAVGDAPARVNLRQELILDGGISHWRGASLDNSSALGAVPEGLLRVTNHAEFSWYSGKIELSGVYLQEGAVMNVRQEAGPLRVDVLEVGITASPAYLNISSANPAHEMTGDLVCRCSIDVGDQGVMMLHEIGDPLTSGSIIWDVTTPWTGQNLWLAPPGTVEETGGLLVRHGHPNPGGPGVTLELPIDNQGTIQMLYNARLYLGTGPATPSSWLDNGGNLILHDSAILTVEGGMNIGLEAVIVAVGGESEIHGDIRFFGGRLVVGGIGEAAELFVSGSVIVSGTGFRLDVSVDPGTPGSSDLLSITGTFTIEPGVGAHLTVWADGPEPDPLDRWQIVFAAGGRSGTFASVLVLGWALEIDYGGIFIDLYRP